jgi:hypothetical protein
MPRGRARARRSGPLAGTRPRGSMRPRDPAQVRPGGRGSARRGGRGCPLAGARPRGSTRPGDPAPRWRPCSGIPALAGLLWRRTPTNRAAVPRRLPRSLPWACSLSPGQKQSFAQWGPHMRDEARISYFQLCPN